MKKKNLFFLAPILLITPVFFSLTSCNGFSTAKLTRIYDGLNFHDFTSSNKQSLEKLYYGTRDINKGNYVLLFGATCQTKGLTSKAPIGNRLETTFNNSILNFNNQATYNEDDLNAFEINPNSIQAANDESNSLYSGIEQWKISNEPNYNLNVFSNYEKANLLSYANGANNHDDWNYDDYDFICSPFYKWTTEDFYNGDYNPLGKTGDDEKEFKKQNNWEQHHQIGKYARNDASAKQYRDLISYLQAISPVTFPAGANAESDSFCMYYYRGKFQYATNVSSSNYDFSTDLINYYPHVE